MRSQLAVLLVAAVVTLLLPGAAVSVNTVLNNALITSLSPEATNPAAWSAGSLGGGTSLYIRGTGFSTNGENEVFIGTEPCEIVQFESNTGSVVVCNTPSNNYQQTIAVSVYVSGVLATCDVPEGCDFTYLRSRTPALIAVEPVANAGAGEITIRGRFHADDADDIASILVGVSTCMIDEDTGDDDVNENSIKCTVPANTPTGEVKVKVIHTIEGAAAPWATALRTSLSSSSVFSFTQVPEVTDVSAHSGSTAGGTTVVVSGTGFGSDSTVSINGADCAVSEVTGDHLTCVTSPQNQSSATEFVGSSGWTYNVYEGISGGSLTNLLSDPLYPDSPNQTFGLLSAEAPSLDLDNYGSELTGLYIAPVTGTYTFFVAADDRASLRLGSNSADAVEIASLSSHSEKGDYWRYPSQQGSIDLIAGSAYWVSVLHGEGGGGSHLSVAVQIPSAVLEVDSTIEVQQFLITNAVTPLTQVVDVAGATTGTFYLRLNVYEDGELDIQRTNPIGPTTTAAELKTELEGLGAYTKVAVSETSSGVFSVTIEEPQQVPGAPELAVVGLDGFDATSPSVTVSVPASAPFDGVYYIAVQGYESGPIAHDADAETIATALESVPSTVGRVDVIARDTRGFDVYFDGRAGADVPDMVLRTDELISWQGTATVTELQKGGTARFVDPIGVDSMRQWSTDAHVVVTSHSVESTCAVGSDCTFQYLDAETPQVTTVVQNILDLTITGSGFSATDAENEITVGGIVCAVTSSTPTLVECTLASGGPGGSSPIVFLLLDAQGDALGYANVQDGNDVVFTLDATTLSSAVSSSAGGAVITITGTGFGDGATVLIDDAACVVDPASVTYTTLTCVTGAHAAGVENVTVSFNSQQSSPGNLTYQVPAPVVSGVSPSEADSFASTVVVVNVTKSGFTGTFSSIFLGETECTGAVVTADNITCTVSGSDHLGAQPLLIVMETLGGDTFGYVETTETFTFLLQADSLSETQGSIAGGQTVIIHGQGLGTFPLESYVVTIGDEDCEVVASNDTSVTCVTGRVDAADDGIHNVVVTVNGKTALGNLQYTYISSDIATIESSSPASGVAGDVLTLTGTNFGTNFSDTTVLIGGVDCAVTAATNSTIQCTIGAGVAGVEHPIQAWDSAGRLDFISLFEFTHDLVVDAISPTSAGVGGAVITVTGNGFDASADATYVTFGPYVCDVESVDSPTSLTCLLSPGAPDASEDAAVSLSNGASSTCSGACAFTYLSSVDSPTITSITPVSWNAISGDTNVTIGGTGFSTDSNSNTVTLGDSSGFVHTATNTSMLVTFNAVPAGSHTLRVALPTVGFALADGVDPTVTVWADVSSSTPSIGSYGGGTSLTITGGGFSDSSRFTLCEAECVVTSSSFGSISCDTSILANQAFLDATSTTQTPVVLTSHAVVTGSPTASIAFDGDVNTFLSVPSGECSIGLDFGAGAVATLTAARVFPRSTSAQSVAPINGMILEASNDLATWTEFATLAGLQLGWNDVALVNGSAFRYYRLSGDGTTNAGCNVAELELTGTVLSTDADGLCDLVVSDRVSGEEFGRLADAFQYDLASTPTVTGVSPAEGTSAGGELITITGTNLAAITFVSFDSIECTLLSATANTITCTSGFRSSSTAERGTIVVSEPGGSAAAIADDASFTYLDLWSSTATWGGEAPPIAGDTVVISAGQYIVLDVSPPELNLLIIEGTLEFQRSGTGALNLDATYIFVRNGGHLIVGTEDEPFTRDATITLHGTPTTPELPVYGAKVLAARFGTIDLHGTPKITTWSRLTADVNPGDTTLTCAQANWTIGDSIVIASSTYDMNAYDVVTITAFSPDHTTWTFTPALSYHHNGDTESAGGKSFEMRAEVGLLTHNVKVQGDSSSAADQFGGHVMLFSPGDDSSIGRFTWTEFSNMGQAFRLGRYPIHLHLLGNVPSSHILNCAVHHTFNRAVTIHGVHQLTVQGNVVFENMGHAIFLEDGIETQNNIVDNLAIATRASHSLLMTDTTPASFWITNPLNTFTGNVAAGSEKYGFWFDLPPNPTGPSATSSVCPQGMPLGAFSGNTAHSNGKYGLRVFDFWIPRSNPCGSSSDYTGNPPVTATLTGFTGYKNQKNGVAATVIGDVRFDDFMLADNFVAGFEASEIVAPVDLARLENSVIVGASATNKWESNPVGFGYLAPRRDGFTVRDVAFVNFGSEPAMGICSRCTHGATEDLGARTTTFSQISYVNTNVMIHWGYPYKGIFWDLDGSLTGTAVANTYVTNTQPSLTHSTAVTAAPDPAWEGGIFCAPPETIRSVEFGGNVSPSGLFKGQQLFVANIKDEVDESEFPPHKKNQKGWRAPFVTNEVYSVRWNGDQDFDRLELTPSVYTEVTDVITLSFDYVGVRDHFEVTVSGTPSVDRTDLGRLPVSSDPHGSFYQDKTERKFYVLIKGTEKLIVKGDRCPVAGCLSPVDALAGRESFQRLWSNTSMWPGGVLPSTSEDVFIPFPWRVIMDVQPARIGALELQGILDFDRRLESTELEADTILIQQGVLQAGTADAPFNKEAIVTLHGDVGSPHLAVADNIDAGNKVIANFGFLRLFGQKYASTWTEVTSTISANDTIVVDGEMDWPVGAAVVVTSSGWDEGDAEERTLIAVVVAAGETTLTLDSALSAGRVASTPFTSSNGLLVDTRPEVALLSRNVIVRGAPEVTGLHGCAVLTSQFELDSELIVGHLELSNVEFNNCGQVDSNHHAVKLDAATLTSFVEDCAFRGSHSTALSVKYCYDVTVSGNVIYETVDTSLVVVSSTNVVVSKNLVAGTRERDQSLSTNLLLLSSYQICALGGSCPGLVVEDNVAAGSQDFGFFMPGVACDDPDAVPSNEAHSNRIGMFAWPAHPSGCSRISSITAWRNSQFGVFSFASGSASAELLVLSDNVVGVNVNYGNAALSDVGTDNRADVLDSVIIGMSSDNSGCGEALPISPSNLKNKAQYNTQTVRVGIQAATFSAGSAHIPPTSSALPYDNMKSEAGFGGLATIDNVEFRDFRTSAYGCDNTIIGAIVSNGLSPDAFHTHQVSNIVTNNVDTNALVYLHDPNPGWANGDDCGTFTCTGLNNALVRDLDGSFGTGGVAIVHNTPGVASGNCTAVPAWNAYECDNEFKLLMFENRDADRFTRRVSPVIVTSDADADHADAYSNTLNSMMDHGWDFDYTSLLRLGRFPTVVETDRTYNVDLTGTMPRNMRFQLQSAAPDEYVIVVIRYETPESVRVRVAGSPTLTFPTVSDDLPDVSGVTGTSTYTPLQRTLRVLVKGDTALSLEVQDIVYISITLSVSVSDFYDNDSETDFIDRTAYVLGIDASRIRFVTIYPAATSKRRSVQAEESIVLIIIDGEGNSEDALWALVSLAENGAAAIAGPTEHTAINAGVSLGSATTFSNDDGVEKFQRCGPKSRPACALTADVPEFAFNATSNATDATYNQTMAIYMDLVDFETLQDGDELPEGWVDPRTTGPAPPIEASNVGFQVHVVDTDGVPVTELTRPVQVLLCPPRVESDTAVLYGYVESGNGDTHGDGVWSTSADICAKFASNFTDTVDTSGDGYDDAGCFSFTVCHLSTQYQLFNLFDAPTFSPTPPPSPTPTATPTATPTPALCPDRTSIYIQDAASITLEDDEAETLLIAVDGVETLYVYGFEADTDSTCHDRIDFGLIERLIQVLTYVKNGDFWIEFIFRDQFDERSMEAVDSVHYVVLDGVASIDLDALEYTLVSGDEPDLEEEPDNTNDNTNNDDDSDFTTGRDTNNSHDKLEDWEIALIVVSSVLGLFILIAIILILVLCLRGKGGGGGGSHFSTNVNRQENIEKM